ncbi:hypothetical protein [Pseudophaeobacter sp. EL27]|uniref:hypothetical protein n=1 Tax=Pseudophaeobacter sp. EL27 TaxID=2107580 RepID=UPI0013C5206C|nr:hypothetical protein [Pseudophaeobacter sp. EL27]
MAIKRPKPEEIVVKLRLVEVLMGPPQLAVDGSYAQKAGFAKPWWLTKASGATGPYLPLTIGRHAAVQLPSSGRWRPEQHMSRHSSAMKSMWT